MTDPNITAQQEEEQAEAPPRRLATWRDRLTERASRADPAWGITDNKELGRVLRWRESCRALVAAFRTLIAASLTLLALRGGDVAAFFGVPLT